MARRKRPFDTAWIAFGLLLGASLLSAGILQQLMEETPVFGVLVLLMLFGMAWYGGSLEGNQLREEAAKHHREARSEAEAAARERRMAEQLADETQQAQEALRHQQIALDAMEAACDEKNRGNDRRFIEMSCELPLEKRIEVSLRVGAYPSESDESYQRRRQTLIDRRVGEWRARRRFGHHLLSLVEEQRGLCGNPKKDPSGKGCGAYLYNFPPTAVHVDHIRPQSKGGSNDHANLQALCSYCNTSAGSRT